MTATYVAVLTPPGAGAIATVAVAGPTAWDAVRVLFRPAGSSPLPLEPTLHRFWFGTFGVGVGDEVVLAVRKIKPETRVEVHCHGGRHVVRWMVEQLSKQGCVEVTATDLERRKPGDGRPWALGARSAWELLPRATTLRTASILLDQYHGAFDRAWAAVETGDAQTLRELHARIPLGLHLVEPWKVVIAGPPNVGKSSLLNALTGYQRSVVSETAGTTRDVVTASVAFEGWPIELADTAGLRRAVESLESAGIERAREFLAGADLVIWVMDTTAAEPELASEDVLQESGLHPKGLLSILNKIDAVGTSEWVRTSTDLAVSAKTGIGIPELIHAIVLRLVGDPPLPGVPIPFTPELARLVEAKIRDSEGYTLRIEE